MTSIIFPKTDIQYAINPFIWTKKQMSANDELLQACLDAYERDELSHQKEYKSNLNTFKDRFNTWEINLELAKNSIK